MTDKKLHEIGEWLNKQGLDIDLTDDFWMEDCRFQEYKLRDIAELLEEYHQQFIPTDEEIEKQANDVIMNYLTHNNPEGDFKESTIGADDKRIWWGKGATWLRDKMK